MSPLQNAARQKAGTKRMTLQEIAREYREQEERYRIRIGELRARKKSCSPKEAYYLSRRIAELTALRRETREIATLLEHYYERGYYKNGKYAL